MKLRYFLTLIFFIVALTPVMLFRAWPYSTVLDNELDEVHERHLLLAQNIAAALERYHRDVSSTFSMLIANADSWQSAPEVSRILDNLSFRHICLVDIGTGQVIGSLETASRPCPDVVPEQILTRFASDIAMNDVVFGEVVVLGDENVIHVVKGLPDNRLAIGAISTRYFRDLGSAISFGVNGHAAIVDQAGNVLSHPRPDWVAERKNISAVSAVGRMMRGESGVEIFYTPAFDADMVAGFTSVQPVGWGVMIPQPLEELTSKAESARQSAVLILLLGVTGSLVFALVLSLLLAQPLEEVTRASRDVAKGSLALPRVPASVRLLPHEFGDLLSGFRDMILRLRESTSKINALAFVDSVTGLANREHFRRSVNTFIDYADFDKEASILFLDLDGFKAVNDTKGHDVGDAVLVTLAERICEVLDVAPLVTTNPDEASIHARREEAQVARLGGDEFSVFLPCIDRENAFRLAHGLLQAIERPITVGEHRLSLSASIGVARYPDDAQEYTSLLKCADTAMYESKRAGKNQVTRYSGVMPQQDSRQQRLSNDLFSKDVGRQMEMLFQPVYRAKDLSVGSVECLIRWQHPDEGLLGPEDFFEAASELGLMRQIDNMVAERTTIIAEQIATEGLAPVLFSMNLSMERLVDKPFIDRFIAMLPERCPVAIELTESSLLDALDTRSAWTIDRLKEAGVAVCLDDFGARHASLSSLLDLGPSSIKLDGHLISRVSPGNEIATIVESVTTMAHDLGIEVVAKGVENIRSISMLRELGCDHVQGYALNMPMSRDDLFKYLKNQPATVSA